MKAILVGIDVGATTAIAILDINGNLLGIYSQRHMKNKDITSFILKHGKPIIVATDVSPPPKKIQKIASTLGSLLFYPKKSLSLREKLDLTENYKEKISNKHEEDALASVLKAYNSYNQLFNRIKNLLNKIGMNSYLDAITEKILKRESANLREAIYEISQKPEEKRVDEKEYIRKLQRALRNREENIKVLKKEISRLVRSLKKSRRFLEIVKEKSLRKIKRLEDENRKLRNYLEVLKNFEKLERNGFLPVLDLEKVGRREIEEIDRFVGIEKRVVICNDPKKIEFLRKFNPLCIIVREEKKGIGVPTLLLNKVKILEKGELKFVKKKEIEIG